MFGLGREVAERREDLGLFELQRLLETPPSARLTAMLPQAREAPHPSVTNDTRSSTPSRRLTQNSMVSPHGPLMRT